jgi:hypothetical protein
MEGRRKRAAAPGRIKPVGNRTPAENFATISSRPPAPHVT